MIDLIYNVNFGSPTVEPNVKGSFHNTRLVQVVEGKIDLCGLCHRLICTDNK